MEKNQEIAALDTDTATKKSTMGAAPIGKEGTSIKTGKATKQQKTLRQLFEDILMDTYSAETQLLTALPEIAKAAYNEDLEDAFKDHLEETKQHVARLEKVFERLGITKKSISCEAMKGLIEEGKKIIEEYEESPVRDSALIIAAQKIEHYEIAAYGSLCELADVLDYTTVQDILGRTLEEEENADELLTDIAKDVNDEAFEMGGNDEEE